MLIFIHTGDPTSNPTQNPTARPTSSGCPADYEQGVIYVFSNGCVLNDDQCDASKLLMRKLIERTFNPSQFQMGVFTHDIGSGDMIKTDGTNGGREELLDFIDNLECSNSGQSTSYESTLSSAVSSVAQLDGEAVFGRKVVMVNMCTLGDESTSDICNSLPRPDGKNTQVFILNAGGSRPGQISCGGDTSKVVGLLSVPGFDTDDFENAAKQTETQFVCIKPPTPMPTLQPTGSPTSDPTNNPTPSPSDNPTPSPTDEPTPVPTPNPSPSPTNDPTPMPTPNPSGSPTNDPTPMPSEIPTPNPTKSPTADACDYDTPSPFTQAAVFTVSMGCAITQDECDIAKDLVRELVERMYNTDSALIGVFAHALGDDFDGVVRLTGGEDGSGNFEAFNEQLLDEIDNLECGSSEGEVAFEDALDAATKQLRTWRDTYSGVFDVEKIVVVSFCAPESDDDSCRFANNARYEFVTISAGDQIEENQFLCLVGDDEDDPNAFEFNRIDRAFILNPGVVGRMEDQLCSFDTDSPTPLPTRNPTQNPSPNPTSSPTRMF